MRISRFDVLILTLSDHAKLLEAIGRAGDDDPAPRLVYADALAESGKEFQAELIMVQHELWLRTLSSSSSKTWVSWMSAESERLRFRERILLPLVAGATGLPPDTLEFHRGFVRKIETIERDSAEMATMELDHPTLRFVETLNIRHRIGNLLEILEAPFAPGIVRVEGRIADGHLRRVADVARAIKEVAIASRYLPEIEHVRGSLRRLELIGNDDLNLANVEKLVLNANLPELRHLSIHRAAGANSKLVERIATSPLLAQLESLEIYFMDPGVFPKLIEHAAQFKRVRIALPLRSLEETAWELGARGQMLASFKRPQEALPILVDAYRVSSGSLGTAREAFEEIKRSSLAASTGSAPTRIDDPDEARDREAHRVPELLRWSRAVRREKVIPVGGARHPPSADELLDRVIGAAPEHPGAWGDRAMAWVAEFDRDEAAQAFARALVYEPEQLGVPPREKDISADDVSSVASACAILGDDPEGANEVLHAFGWGGVDTADEGLHLHAAVVAAFAHSAHRRRDAALASLDVVDKRLTQSRFIIVSKLARGFVEREARRVEESNAIWKSCGASLQKPIDITMAMMPPRRGIASIGNPYDLWVCAVASLFATIAAREPVRERIQVLRTWLDNVGPLRPMAAILLRLMIPMSKRLMPHVAIQLVEIEIDILTGSPRQEGA